MTTNYAQIPLMVFIYNKTKAPKYEIISPFQYVVDEWIKYENGKVKNNE